MRLLAQLTAANILLMDSDSKCIFMTFVTGCHGTVTRACPVITSSHHPWVRGHTIITPVIRLLSALDYCDASNLGAAMGNYSSELIRCAILLNVPLPVLWNDVTQSLTCQTLQSVQCPKHTALLISFKLK